MDTFWFTSFHIEKDGDVFVEMCAPGASGNIFYLRRLHCYHPSKTDFRRMLAFVSGTFVSICVYIYMCGPACIVYSVTASASVHMFHWVKSEILALGKL